MVRAQFSGVFSNIPKGVDIKLPENKVITLEEGLKIDLADIQNRFEVPISLEDRGDTLTIRTPGITPVVKGLEEQKINDGLLERNAFVEGRVHSLLYAFGLRPNRDEGNFGDHGLDLRRQRALNGDSPQRVSADKIKGYFDAKLEAAVELMKHLSRNSEKVMTRLPSQKEGRPVRGFDLASLNVASEKVN